ncbi:formyltransferase family protein [Ferrovibrio sp.]|uniref:formyltransferase family protein n=1 Tax=Ferrovibrio sp. TaxID=1917215 RepID=UPI002614C802|nr:formyltransferase family protein [Ferrovibrio sp.]
MRICLLTTETPHHAYFAQTLVADGHDVLTLAEHKRVSPPYETAHHFETERDIFECEAWFNGRQVQLADVADTRSFEDINAPESIKLLASHSPDICITFGTGRLRSEIIAAGGDHLLNLHGGDPEQYRGLDTHLWAIWHRDFYALSTCLHRVATGLDTGDILACLPIDIRPDAALHQLRKANTETCVTLARLAIHQLESTGHLLTRPQRQSGRYYSFMPAALKSVCIEHFARYTGSL